MKLFEAMYVCDLCCNGKMCQLYHKFFSDLTTKHSKLISLLNSFPHFLKHKLSWLILIQIDEGLVLYIGCFILAVSELFINRWETSKKKSAQGQKHSTMALI